MEKNGKKVLGTSKLCSLWFGIATDKAKWSRDEVCVWKHFSVRPIPSSYMVRRRVAIVLLIDVRI